MATQVLPDQNVDIYFMPCHGTILAVQLPDGILGRKEVAGQLGRRHLRRETETLGLTIFY